MREGWRRTTLGEVVEIVIGRTPPRNQPQYWTTVIDRPFCTIADMTGERVLPQREGVTEVAEREGKARRVPAGSLLMSFKLTIGRVGFAEVDLFPNEAIAWLRNDASLMEARYLAISLSAMDLAMLADRAVKGKTLNGSSLRAIPILLPPLDEQRRIVDLIAAVDEAIEATEGVAMKLQATVAAASAELIGSVETETLGDVVSIIAPLVDPRDTTYGTLPYLDIQSIHTGTGTHGSLSTVRAAGPVSTKFLFTEKEVIYSKVRPELRKVTFPRKRGLCSADAYPLRCGPRLLPEYLHEVLLSEKFSMNAIGKSGRTKMPKVNRHELLSIQVPVPDIDTQRQISGLLGMMRESFTTANECAESLRTLRSALLADLLSGDHEIPASYDDLLSA